MGKLSTLASDTVVYGASTILSRLIGWLMMPLYTHVVSKSIYGSFSYIYSFISIFLVLVTLGFETGYFRFVTGDNKDKLLGTLSNAVLGFGGMLLCACIAFPSLFVSMLDFEFGASNETFLWLMMSIVLLDSYNALFFAELRYERQSMKYALLRLLQVLVNVILTVFFLFYLRNQEGYFSEVHDITYMMLANLVGSLFATVVFIKRIVRVIMKIDFSLFKTVLLYSLPLVGMGFFGQANTNIEKILIRHLDTSADSFEQLGIYSACYKIGVLMSIFTQSFRMAFEPFFFKENKDKGDTKIYSDALNYFVAFGLLIFAGVMLYWPLIFKIIEQSYWEGKVILPYILIGQLFFGVYYSLSLWYKVTDRTYWGIIMSAIGLTVNTVMNFILIPRIGYLGAAVSTFVGYTVMMALTYILGQKYYPIAYSVGRISIFMLLVVIVVMGTEYSYQYIGNYWIAVSVPAMVLTIFLLLRFLRLDIRTVVSAVKSKIGRKRA